MFQQDAMKVGKRVSRGVLAACMCLTLGACASVHNGEPGYADPFESMNRGVFAFNEVIDDVALEPAAKGYRAILPKPARKGVRNFLRNLRSPVNIANQLLQGDIEGFASDTIRALVNTTIGFGGFIDIAESAGLPYEHEDFGQTMAVWGIGNGPYLVAPVFGPNSLRDHAGWAVDSYLDPLRLYLFNTNQEVWHYARVGTAGIDKREELLDVLADLESSAIDYYATVRSTLYQNRMAMINDNDPEVAAAPAIPDYDEEEDY